MKRWITPAAAALAVAFTALGPSSVALAQPPERAPAAPPRLPGPAMPRDVITYQESMPNGALIGSGLTMFGFSYIPSMVVAAKSTSGPTPVPSISRGSTTADSPPSSGRS